MSFMAGPKALWTETSSYMLEAFCVWGEESQEEFSPPLGSSPLSLESSSVGESSLLDVVQGGRSPGGTLLDEGESILAGSVEDLSKGG